MTPIEVDEIQSYADRGNRSEGATVIETLSLCVELRKEQAQSARLAAEINRLRPYLIDEADRQMVLLALAHLSIERPGWVYSHEEIAKKLRGLEMFTEFRNLRQGSQ